MGTTENQVTIEKSSRIDMSRQIALWNNLIQKDPNATFFQTPNWFNIAARHYTAEIFLFTFPVAGTFACLPLLRKRRYGAYRYFSPFGTYAALLCEQKLDLESIAFIQRDLERYNLQLTSSPFTQNPIVVGKRIPAKVQVIDLAALDPANLMREWKSGQRRRLGAAKREGVTVRRAVSLSDWDAYFQLYQRCLTRWGAAARVTYPHNLFEAFRTASHENTDVILWLAEHNGVIGAAYLTFYHGRHVIPWHGGADEHFFSLGATQIAFLTIIEDAKNRGYSIFDLTSSGGLSGVEAFKSSFGTSTLMFDSCLNRVGIYEVLGDLKAKIKGNPFG